MSPNWRLKALIYFVCLNSNILCFVESDLVPKRIESKTSASTSNDETFTYNATNSDNSCDGENGNCTFEMTINITDKHNSEITGNSISVTPIVIPSSVSTNDTTTELSVMTDNIMKNISDTMNVTDTTATSIPTTEVSIANFTFPVNIQYCDCDISKNECDINCCCDKDCTQLDKEVFAYCLPFKSEDTLSEASSVDSQHCYTSRFIYKNNTKLLEAVEQRSSDLFCIAVDNLSPKLVYKEFPLIRSINRFNIMLSRFRKRIYNWSRRHYDLVEECDKNMPNVTGLKYGSCIFITKTNSTGVKLFSVPTRSSSISAFCNTYRHVFYLRDLSDDCLRELPRDQLDCESTMDYLNMNHYKNFKVLANPRIHNASYSNYDCLDDSCISVNHSSIILEPTYNSTSETCMNVVDKVEYAVHHNGSQGITQIDVNFHLINVSLNKNRFFRQSVHIKYYQSINNTPANHSTLSKLIRSGTPGYIRGRPVISGKKVTKLDSDYTEEIVLNDDPKSWLTIPKSMAGRGLCDRRERINVSFLQNIRSECFFRIPLDCESIRNQTLQVLFGENSINMTDIRETNIYVSKYGDPKSDLSKWVPVLTDINPVKNKDFFNCIEAFTNIDYKIIYSYTRNIRKPQAAIIGVMVSLSKPGDVVVQSGSNFSLIRIRSSVSFVDVTRLDGVVTRFADPPVYEIKLPADFFYPFLSMSAKMSSSAAVCGLCPSACLCLLMAMPILWLATLV